jgi:hypothetical protein
MSKDIPYQECEDCGKNIYVCYCGNIYVCDDEDIEDE